MKTQTQRTSLWTLGKECGAETAAGQVSCGGQSRERGTRRTAHGASPALRDDRDECVGVGGGRQRGRSCMYVTVDSSCPTADSNAILPSNHPPIKN